MPLLQADQVSMAIDSTTLLNDVSLRINAGEMIAIVGPNGAGKSTLLRLLSGDLRATRGSIQIQGVDLHTYAPRELALRRAMLSQHTNVSFPFTVEEIVCMGAGDADRTAAKSLVESALNEVGLCAFRNRNIQTLSGGEQQRAHFARVLVQLTCGESTQGPGLLLLDEPTSNLDLLHQIDLIDTAKKRASNGTSVIAILHDLNLAARFAERVIVLCKGAIFADGPPKKIITDEMLRRVFEIDVTVGCAEDGSPFILPQMMRSILVDS